MGYYAWGSGEIAFTDLLDDDSADSIVDLASEIFPMVSIKEYGEEDLKYSVLELDYDYDKYYDDDLWEVLNGISDIAEVSDAYITFHGEDDCFWKFVYRDGEWDDVAGDIVWRDEKFVDITDDELLEECHKRNIIGRLYIELMDLID